MTVTKHDEILRARDKHDTPLTTLPFVIKPPHGEIQHPLKVSFQFQFKIRLTRAFPLSILCARPLVRLTAALHRFGTRQHKHRTGTIHRGTWFAFSVL